MASQLFTYSQSVVGYLIIPSAILLLLKVHLHEKPNTVGLVHISDPRSWVDSSKWSYWVKGHDYI